jgi:hypothetical protein
LALLFKKLASPGLVEGTIPLKLYVGDTSCVFAAYSILGKRSIFRKKEVFVTVNLFKFDLLELQV